jgi:Helix-turn-helix domain
MSIPENWQGKFALSVNSTAEILAVTPVTVWNMIRRGELDSFLVGRSRRVFVESLLSYINRADTREAA